MKYYSIPKFNEITEAIVDMMPSVRPFFEGNLPIREYSEQLYRYAPDPIHAERQTFFRKLVTGKVHRLFNKTELKKINIFSDNNGLVGGVVDHHGILNNPVLIGVNIVPNYFHMFNRPASGDILTFATGNNPLGNIFHRRGFVIDDKKVTIYPKSYKNKIVYGLPIFDFSIKEHLEKSKVWHSLTPAAQIFLENAEALIRKIDISTCTTLGDQLTKINFYLWPLLFEKSIRDRVSKLISIEYDDIVNECLIHVLKQDKDNFLYRMLFDINFRRRLLQHFEGSIGAWDAGRDTGTHFFWHLDAQNEPQKMTLDGDRLICAQDNFKIQLNLEDLALAIKEKKIFAGMLLKFSLLIFYIGLKPFSGYGSAYYLSIMQKKLIDLIRTDFPQEAERASKIAVNNVTSIPVLVRKDPLGGINNYFAFDIIKDGGLPMAYFEKINSVPIKYFMAPNLPAMYEYAFNLYGKGEKKSFNLTSKDFAELLKSAVS